MLDISNIDTYIMFRFSLERCLDFFLQTQLHSEHICCAGQQNDLSTNL